MMTELSKTARASLGKQIKEVHVETTEEAIKAIRVNREAGLFIGDMSRVDKLLAAYDRELSAVATLAPATAGLLKRAEIAEETVVNLRTQLLDSSWTNLLEEGKSYRVMRVHDEVSVEPLEFIKPNPPVLDPEIRKAGDEIVQSMVASLKVVLATIPA
jgi:hypothetical protein